MDQGSDRAIDVHARIDPQSAAGLQAYLEVIGPRGINGIADLGERRSRMQALTAGKRAEAPTNPRVRMSAGEIPGLLPGDPPIPVRTYHPVSDSAAPRPGVLFIHGGGMVLGDLDEDEDTAIVIADRADAVVVSVGYRLAPEHPFPAGPHDCFAALRWLADQAAELGVDATRLAVYGGSAGGGLAIATCLLARDNAGPAVAYLMAIYPMIDDRECTPSSQTILDIGAWDRDGNREAWGWYLSAGADEHLVGYAAPARVDDLAGLPPTFIDVGDLDLFRDEDIDFAARLARAHVPCELHVYPGAYHASELIAPDAALSKQIIDTRLTALRRALHGPEGSIASGHMSREGGTHAEGD